MSQLAYTRSLERQIAEYKRKEATRKQRRTVIFTASMVAFSLMFPVASVIHAKAQWSDWEQTREIKTVYVQRGDSVDGYWAEYAPEWMDRSDYREEIKELNNMDSCYLYAGQTLKIYVEGGN